MRFYKFILLITIVLQPLLITAKSTARGFAIVVDPGVFEKNRAALDAYSQALKEDGLNTFYIVDKWGVPDSIKVRLKELYNKSNLEGAVFVGEIPVPMIRNGQHLTTAFKMDQRREWNRSSVPSDRFYDDFDLKFEYLHRDSVNTLYHYYNLADDSPHYVSSDIYSARIKPPEVPGMDRYQLIDDFLAKVVREKRDKRKIERVTYFAGHGYNSNCMVARADERLTLSTQFSSLRNGKGVVNYIDFTYDDFVRSRLMAELAQENLDIAILHHHGGTNAQYLNGSPNTNIASRWIEMTKKFFRGKIRSSRDTSASKQYYLDNYDVPKSWVENAFNPEVMKQDSLIDAMVDISIADMYGYKPAARFIMLDACFNGSFHLNDYISGHYVFAPGGRTVVVKANSVNTLQDIWPNQLIGLLDLGVSVGNWARDQFTLESHLIGDPTYRYASYRKEDDGFNEAIVNKRGDAKFWKKYLNDANPEVKALSMRMLFLSGDLDTDNLLNIQLTDKEPLVRMQAFTLINKFYNKNIVASIKAGLYDNYELLRRHSARNAATNASPDLMEDIYYLRLSPATSKRVEFQLRGALDAYEKAVALDAFDRYVSASENEWFRERASERGRLEYTLTSRKNEFMQLSDPEIPARNKRFTITALRNSNNVAYLDKLFDFMRESDDSELRVLLAEAFGWYTNSWKRDIIIEFCYKQSIVEKDLLVKKELIRTVNRLKTNPN